MALTSYEDGRRAAHANIEREAPKVGGLDAYITRTREDVEAAVADLSYERGRLAGALEYAAGVRQPSMEASRTEGAVRAFYEAQTKSQGAPWESLARWEVMDWTREFLSRREAAEATQEVPRVGVLPAEVAGQNLWQCPRCRDPLGKHDDGELRECGDDLLRAGLEQEAMVVGLALRGRPSPDAAYGPPVNLAEAERAGAWPYDGPPSVPHRPDPTALSDEHAGAVCGVRFHTGGWCIEPPGHTKGGCRDE